GRVPPFSSSSKRRKAPPSMKAKRHGSGASQSPRFLAAFAGRRAEARLGACLREERRMAKRKAAAPKDDASGADAPAVAPSDSVYIGKSIKPEFILLRLANRHGLVTGATGTGKTVTLQGLAEGFSDQGVPVFCADVKGDLSGVAEAGEMKSW